jgi:hypothetical protein
VLRESSKSCEGCLGQRIYVDASSGVFPQLVGGVRAQLGQMSLQRLLGFHRVQDSARRGRAVED